MKLKVLFILIALLISVIITVSCAASEDPEFFDKSFENESKYDLNGYTIIYYCGGLDGNVLSYDRETLFYDLSMKRIGKVEKELNCVVDARGATGNDKTAMVASTSGGMYYGDAYSWVGDTLEDNAAAGLLTGLTTVSESLDITDSSKWGNRYQLEEISYKDDIYGFVPMSWPHLSYSEIGYFLTINEDTVAKVGGTDPREYVENKTWNWAQFRKCLETFTVMEGGEASVYALPYPGTDFAHMYLSSNGNHLVAFDAEGRVVNGFADGRAYKAMQEAVDVITEYEYAFLKNGIGTEFESGKLCMELTYSTTLLDSVAYTIENFGIVKWPVGPDVDPDYVFSTHSNIRPTSISILTPDADATALILDRIYEPFEEYENQEKIREYMTDSIFFDRRDCDTFFAMAENTRYNYFHYNVAAFMTEYLTSSQTITQSIETLENKLSYVIEKNIEPCVQGIIAVFGSYE